MGPVVHRHADHVDVLLHRHGRDALGRLAQAGVDDLTAGVTQDAGHDAQAAVVAIQAHFGHEHAQRSVVGRHVETGLGRRAGAVHRVKGIAGARWSPALATRRQPRHRARGAARAGSALSNGLLLAMSRRSKAAAETGRAK